MRKLAAPQRHARRTNSVFPEPGRIRLDYSRFYRSGARSSAIHCSLCAQKQAGGFFSRTAYNVFKMYRETQVPLPCGVSHRTGCERVFECLLCFFSHPGAITPMGATTVMGVRAQTRLIESCKKNKIESCRSWYLRPPGAITPVGAMLNRHTPGHTWGQRCLVP